MRKKASLIKFIRLWGLLFLLLVAAGTLLLDITLSYRDFHIQAQEIRQDFIASQKNLIKHEVDGVISMIDQEKSQVFLRAKKAVKSRVYEAGAIAEHIYQLNYQRRSQAEIKELIIEALRPIRFSDGRGYFFISSLDGTMILNSFLPELEDNQQRNRDDSRGQNIYRDLAGIVRQSGEGFYDYYWPKPGIEGNDFKKVTFVKHFAPLNWFIGSGFYVDEVEKQLKQELLDRIAKIRFGDRGDGYIFVVSYDGTTLMNDTQRHLIGKNIWNLSDAYGVKVIQEERRAVEKPDGDFIYYSWNKPSQKKASPKVSFVKGVKDWQWMVGAGVYLDDVEVEIDLMHAELNRQIQTRILAVTLLVMGMALLFLFFFRRLQRRLENDFARFSAFFERAVHSDESIDRDQVRFAELDLLAQDANLMLEGKVKAQQELRREREALLESEKRYRETINLLPQVVWEADCQGKITFINELAFKLSGYVREDFSQGVNIAQLMIPEDRKRVQKNMERLLAGEPLGRIEYTSLRKDGSTFPISTYASPIMSKGQVVGARGVAIDISERKQHEKEMLKVRKLESVGILAGGIAHDFNNILAAIMGNISLALSLSDPADEIYDLLESSEKASVRAKNLTQQLLTFAKGGEPVKKMAAIDTVIRDSASFVLSGSKVNCDFRFADDLWPLLIDAGQISQVVQNIIINSVQAMPTGGTIAIDCCNFHMEKGTATPLQPGKYVRIMIRDHGFGIPEAMLDKIFDPYFTSKDQGSGLGLAITHSIISKHDGLITVDSEIGQGTTFCIYLPAGHADEKIEVEKELPASTVASARIMIMDDEEMICSLVESALSRFGYDVLTAVDGEAALQLFRDSRAAGKQIDLILMDLTIPGGMGGEDVVREIRKLDSQVKIVVCSGYSTDPVMANFNDHGFDAALVKPFLIKDLNECVARVMAG